jgi:hypothetical protein
MNINSVMLLLIILGGCAVEEVNWLVLDKREWVCTETKYGSKGVATECVTYRKLK